MLLIVNLVLSTFHKGTWQIGESGRSPWPSLHKFPRRVKDKPFPSSEWFVSSCVFLFLCSMAQVCNCFGLQIQYAFVPYHWNGEFVVTVKRILQYLNGTSGPGFLWFAYLDMSQFLARTKVSDKWIDLAVAVFAETAHTLDFFPLSSSHWAFRFLANLEPLMPAIHLLGHLLLRFVDWLRGWECL